MIHTRTRASCYRKHDCLPSQKQLLTLSRDIEQSKLIRGMSAPPTKKQLRAFFRIHRPVLAEGVHQALRENLLRVLNNFPATQTIASFAGLPHEPQLLELVELMPQHRWLLPRVSGDEMRFHVVTDPPTQLELGPFGIRQPQARCKEVTLAEIDIALCPAEAFGRDGSRLGKGGGYYDRFFQQREPHSMLIGIGFAHQIIAAVPMEPHDIRMHLLVSETGWQAPNHSS